MSALPNLRKGWCPGVLRPMPSGDGLIMRLRISGGRIDAVRLLRIAEIAASHGNGAIDLTRRANLQLRGCTQDSAARAAEEVAGLGLADATADAEAVRNVMVSPLAGIDPACRDGSAIAAELEQRLATGPEWRALPGKFGFAVDGGGRWPLGETGADVTAIGAPTGWRIRLGGAAGASQPVGAAETADAMLRCARLFVGKGVPARFTRYRELVAELGASSCSAASGLRDMPWADVPAGKPGPGVTAFPTAAVAAIGLPFGRIDARDLMTLVGTSAQAEFRLTPWRLVCAVTAQEAEAREILARGEALGLATQADDVRLTIDACVGAPSCANATTQTRADAARLAAALSERGGAPRTIHVSGCQKGCAHSGPAALTFVGRDGRYDVMPDGTPTDPPAHRGIDPQILARFAMEAVRP